MHLIHHGALDDFVSLIFKKIGSSDHEAECITYHLVLANLTGHDSHGVLRAPQYIDWFQNGFVFANRNLDVVSENDSFVVADGNFGFGQVIGEQATVLGINAARKYGVSVVALRNSGHLGRIGDFALQAAEEGLISIHFVNTNGFGILVAPFGGTDARLSTNPVTIGVPRENGEHVILDMATSAYSEGKVRAAVNRGNRLPHGILVDGSGKPTNDPNALYTNPPGALLPLGGYKGHGLSIICEILAGSLTGSGSSNPRNPTMPKLANGMLSIFFDPKRLTENSALEEDICSLVSWVTASPTAVQGTEILMPGEIERKTKQVRLLNGIPLDKNTRSQLIASARLVGLPDKSFAFLS